MRYSVMSPPIDVVALRPSSTLSTNGRGPIRHLPVDECFRDHPVALLLERRGPHLVRPHSRAYRLADSVPLPGPRVARVCAVPGQERRLECGVATELLCREPGEVGVRRT